MRKSLSYILYGVSLADVSCRPRWPAPTRPTLALTTLLWASRQAVASWRQLGGNFLRLLLAMFMSIKLVHNPHCKLNIDSNRNTKNIKITKIAVEHAKLCGKICDMRTLLKYAKNATTCEICGNRIFA